jgi:hypothetical protein
MPDAAVSKTMGTHFHPVVDFSPAENHRHFHGILDVFRSILAKLAGMTSPIWPTPTIKICIIQHLIIEFYGSLGFAAIARR